jgi:hypothetical protein
MAEADQLALYVESAWGAVAGLPRLRFPGRSLNRTCGFIRADVGHGVDLPCPIELGSR